MLCHDYANSIQKKIILQVVNVFETGTPEGKYDKITVLPDGRGGSRQITYGRSQTTEQGNLKALIELYIEKEGLFAAPFAAYLPKIGTQPLSQDVEFRRLLTKSARLDPVMRAAQDEFFDQLYYQPAESFFEYNRFELPLSMLVIYDSYIHSGSILPKLRNRFPERTPRNGGSEEAWIKAYVNTRHHWLANHNRHVVRKTIYRTQCFKNQIEAGNWEFEQPLMVQGVVIPGVGQLVPA